MEVRIINNFVLEMKGIKKHFGGIKALDGVELKVQAGEVHALLGENGAGKSTLMKILGGSYTMDEGEIFIDGKKADLSSPLKAQRYGIAVIYQEQALVDCLTVADNILLGRIPNKIGVIDEEKLNVSVEEALSLVGADLNSNDLVGNLSVAQKQFVEIAKAVSMNARIIVMDEPTAVLTLPETEKLFKLIRHLQSQGRSIIYISHRLEELSQIANRCTVLKDGVYIGTKMIEGVTKEILITMMTGRTIKNIYPSKSKKIGKVCLEVKRLSRKNVFNEITFSVCEGEIVGLSGLVGSGRSEVCRSIFGIDPKESGEVILSGKKLNLKSAGQALSEGIVYITEDRKGDGLFLEMSIGKNISISILHTICKIGVINKKKEERIVKKYINKLQVKCARESQKVGELSGGNQQKVMIARAMLAKAKVVIIDEPTRGVDVGTKTEIYKIIRNIADNGCAVIIISSELPEIIGMSDRIIVMHNGRITGELLSAEATEKNILTAATGGK